jgi:hypothetical protein
MNDCRPQREILAQGPICQIEQCECGTVHVTIGPLTFRAHGEAIVSLWTTLGEAVHRLSAQRSGVRAPVSPWVMPS